jgi:hypothetical protein
MKKISIIILLSSMVIVSIFAQEQNSVPSNMAPSWSDTELITDRPDQTESSSTVPRNTLQIETGFIFGEFQYRPL